VRLVAVLYDRIEDVIDNMRFQCDASIAMAGLSNYLELYKVLYPDLINYHLTRPEKNELLKKLTGCLAATGTDLNCYPAGLDTAYLFDMDGNRIVP
jgi:hypothetical protein